MGLAAALASSAAVALAMESPQRRLAARLAAVPDRTVVPMMHHRVSWFVAGLAVVAAGGLVGGRPGATLAAAGVVIATALAVLQVRARRRRAARNARIQVVAAGETLAGLVRVGAIPAAALAVAAEEHPVLAEAAARQAVGGELVPALREAATKPGWDGLADIAAAWEVAQRTGASICDSIEAAAEELRRREEAAATVRVELAASRAAGRLMSGLPVIGIAMGFAFGGDPVVFLTRNFLGQVCLLLAAILAAAGLLWTDTIAERSAR